MVEEQKIWDKEKEVKKIVLEWFYKWIHIFGKKASKRMPIRKIWNHVIDMKKGFVLKKEKVYPLLREERNEICKFISKQLRKGYIRFLKLSQIALVFFVKKKKVDGTGLYIFK